MADEHLTQIKDLFVQYDSDADNSLELNELVRLLEDLGKKITSLPAVRFLFSPSWLRSYSALL